MASDASTIAANERHSIIPNASAIIAPPSPSSVSSLAAPDAALHVLECGLRRGDGDVDIAILAGEVDAPERSERDDFEDLDARGLLGLVRRDGRVGRRLDLEGVERLMGDDHVPVAHAIDE